MVEQQDQVAVTCVTLEVLAAFVDGTLDSHRRLDVQAHLASCESCYELVVEMLREEVSESHAAGEPVRLRIVSEDDNRAVLAVSDPANLVESPDSDTEGSGTRRDYFAAFSASLPSKRSHRLEIVAAALAAGLLLAVTIGFWFQSRQHQQWFAADGTAVAALVQAVGPERLVPGRPTGGFQYGPLRSPTRSARGLPATNLSLRSSAIAALERAQSDPSSPNLHAAGLGQLLLWQYDDAIRLLQAAVTDDGTHAGYQSDLSAAYLARASVRDGRQDWLNALAHAERALSLNHSLIEAHYNRAFALDALGRAEAADAAWRLILSTDRSPWRQLADSRLHPSRK